MRFNLTAKMSFVVTIIKFYVLSCYLSNFSYGNSNTEIERNETKQTIITEKNYDTMILPQSGNKKNNLDPQKDTSVRIVGGQKCPVEDFPFIVTIHDIYYAHICGGTLLSETWVLTAAHCCRVNLLYGENTVYAGITSQVQLTGQKSIVLRVHRHPDYDDRHLKYDIGLMALENPIKPSSAVKFVKIAKQFKNGSVPRICKYGQVLGYGIQDIKPIFGPSLTLQDYDPQLQCATLAAVTDPVVCMIHSANLYDGLKFCATSEQGGTDTCKGDSGGPFVCGDVQFGIVSGGIGCGLRGFAGTYTNVYMFTDFIEKTMSNGINLNCSICFVLGSMLSFKNIYFTL